MDLVDKEWENFLKSSNTEKCDNDYDYNIDDHVYNINNIEDINNIGDINNIEDININNIGNTNLERLTNENNNNDELKNDLNENTKFPIHVPEATDIYISTKTKIAYLNTQIDLKKLFWDLPLISYNIADDGIIKKQMKFNIQNEDELNLIQEKLKKEKYFEEYIITHINNPSGRIKFKDVRKISIGLCKKDILSYRLKKKSAFYNCFAIILRLKICHEFKEYHVKIFNTGKLEIPGVKDDIIFEKILIKVTNILQSIIDNIQLEYVHNKEENVLINSNFNCGFYINREILYELLKFKYNIQAIYDPCSYPGIQCKFYYNSELDFQDGCQILNPDKEKYNNLKEVSFMIFRTGSVLIVGKCHEKILIKIYEFLKRILKNEYQNIYQNYNIECQRNNNTKIKSKKTKIKNIIITST